MIRSLFLLLGVIAAVFPKLVAQQSDSITLQTVVVTASKMPQNAKEVPQPVRVIDRATIDRSLGKDLAQVLQEQVGLTVNGAYSNPGQNKSIYLRGAGNGYALLLVDGMPLQDASGISGSFDLRLLSLDRVERIEILPGSQSTLYGSDAVAGVINIITRQAATESLASDLQVSYGSLNTLQLSAAASGQHGKLSYGGHYERLTTDGISEARPPTDIDNFDTDGLTRQTADLMLGYDNDRQLRLNSFYRYSQQVGDFDGGAFTDSPDSYTTRYWQTGLQTELNWQKLELRVKYQYGETASTFFTSFGEDSYNGQTHQVDAYANHQLSNRNRLIAGTYWQNAATLLTNISGTEERKANYTIAPYAQLDGQWGKGWQWVAGARLNVHANFGTQPTYSVSLARDLSAQWRAHAAYATGFKAPTLPELFGPFGANADLKPQRSRTAEMGLRYEAKAQQWSAAINLFQRHIDDIIVYAFQPGYFNQDEQDDHGLELEGHWQMTDALRWQLGYTYLDGDVTTRSEAGQDTSYYNLLRRPRHEVQLGLTWQVVPGVTFSAQGQYLGQREDLFFNPAQFFTAEPVTLDTYLLLNAYADYRFGNDRYLIYVDVKNMTNADFSEVYGFNQPGLVVRIGGRARLF